MRDEPEHKTLTAVKNAFGTEHRGMYWRSCYDIRVGCHPLGMISQPDGLFVVSHVRR
jgi:hypothetical protein